jgi:predicted TIM-barrel fold metal-dependent hydrolase
MINRVMFRFLPILILFTSLLPCWTLAEEPIRLKYSRSEIEDKWRDRIQSFLNKGVIPLIDFLSFLPRKGSAPVINWTKEEMDKEGVALISFAGYWAPEEPGSEDHHWDYFIHRVVNADPDRFILTTNKGSNKNWWKQKSGSPEDFIDQLEQQVRRGEYPFIGQIEFRHYISNAQRRADKAARDIDIPLNGPTGHRVFKLSADTGVPFSIHLEPENAPLDALEQMLRAYPKAKVIISHFGQIRHPDRQQRFGPKLVERLLITYPNLYFDLSTGEPGRVYRSGNQRVLDTVIWEDDNQGGQRAMLKSEYKAILSQFSNRFVTGFDYGPSNRQSAGYLKLRIANIRLILRDLPDAAKHDIGYRNAWFLLTNRAWQ